VDQLKANNGPPIGRETSVHRESTNCQVILTVPRACNNKSNPLKKIHTEQQAHRQKRRIKELKEVVKRGSKGGFPLLSPQKPPCRPPHRYRRETRIFCSTLSIERFSQEKSRGDRLHRPAAAAWCCSLLKCCGGFPSMASHTGPFGPLTKKHRVAYRCQTIQKPQLFMLRPAE
jgi:hypothetical protein